MATEQTLDSFVTELRRDVDSFEAWWRKKNAENPEMFEMEYPEENGGLWFEQFLYFMQDETAQNEGAEALAEAKNV